MIKVDSFSFQGVNGAYSEQAGKNIFPNATSIPCATFEDMFEHVRSGKSEAAMVPIENSLAGRVADTGVDPLPLMKRCIKKSKNKIIS